MHNHNNIYLDNNATTQLDPLVLASILPIYESGYGNSSSTTHLRGRAAARRIEEARQQTCSAIGAGLEEITFTSGATESINIALTGIYLAYQSKGRHIITWQTEHPAVLETLNNLEVKGASVTYLPVSRNGMPDLTELDNNITDQTIMVVMMAANNETGTINPLKEVADIAHRKDVIVFCDATQAIGKIKFDVNESGVDAASFSAHKFYGPQGTGALYLRRKNPRVVVKPLMFGGSQEKGIRPGTMNVPGVVGMGAAIQLAEKNLWDESARISKLRTLLEQGIMNCGEVTVNGNMKDRLPNTTNLLIRGVNNNKLMVACPHTEFSAGSACTSVHPKPSHVLDAMKLSDEECKSSVRFSLGRFTTEEEILHTIEKISSAISSIRNEGH
jgi:cysteine desulfurase